MESNKRILVVDDDPDIAQMVQTRLESAGYAVQSVYSGEAALTKVKNEKPDLVVLDVMLPQLSGYEVCARLKTESVSKDIPVILLTSRDKMIDERMGYVCKADSYIRKPRCGDRLLPEVERLLSRSGLAES